MLVIKHKRGDCIGCNACVEQAPSHFEMAEDGLVSLRQIDKSVEINGAVMQYARAPNQDADELQTAEDMCPTHIISIHPAGKSGF